VKCDVIKAVTVKLLHSQLHGWAYVKIKHNIMWLEDHILVFARWATWFESQPGLGENAWVHALVGLAYCAPDWYGLLSLCNSLGSLAVSGAWVGVQRNCI